MKKYSITLDEEEEKFIVELSNKFVEGNMASLLFIKMNEDKIKTLFEEFKLKLKIERV